MATPPSRETITVAIEALREDGVKWRDAATELEAARAIASGLWLGQFELVSGVLVALRDADLVADMALTIGAVVPLGLLGTNVRTLVRTVRRVRSVPTP